MTLIECFNSNECKTGYPFEKSKWDNMANSDIKSNRDIHSHTNCYSYAFNKINNAKKGDKIHGIDIHTKHQPGVLSGEKYRDYDCTEIMEKVKKDWNWYSIEECTLEEKLPCNRYRIALVIDNSGKHKDYHFYRQDNNGYWSHKMGSKKVSNIDACNKAIKDPKEACRNYDKKNNDKYNYNIFCGYYSVPITGTEPINLYK